MSRIEYVKSRLGDMILRDRGDVDEKTAALIKSELRTAIERFLILRDFSVDFVPCDSGEVSLTVRATGRRLRRMDSM